MILDSTFKTYSNVVKVVYRRLEFVIPQCMKAAMFLTINPCRPEFIIVLVNQFQGNFRSKTLCCRKIKCIFRVAKLMHREGLKG